MKPANPVIVQAISAGTIVVVVKAILEVLLAFHVFTFDERQNNTVSYLIDVGVPLLAILGSALWASRKVTSLAAPRDIDGAPLTRPDNTPAIAELEKVHSEALKVNQAVDKIADERRIK